MGAFVFVFLAALAIWRFRAIVRLNRSLRALIIEREHAEAALRESESRLWGVMDSAADAIITIDEHGLIDSFNRAASLMFGYTVEEIRGQNVSLLMTEPDKSQHDGYIKKYLETGKARIIGIGLRELTAIRKDGTKFPIELSVAESQSDRNRFFIGSVRNITERKEAQEILQQAQKMEAIGQLTGGVAHDFNNLLTVILGNLQLLGECVADDENARKLVDSALRAGFRGADLTQRLLAFSRKQPLASKPTDINKCVTGAAELIRRTLGENIEIETVLSGGLWRAMIDENQLETALLNLAINSRDAMPDAGKLTIETMNSHLDQEYAKHKTEVTPGQYVMITVSDTGSGMSPEVLKRVFEPFFTTKEVGKGTGLGLSMIYGFVKQSGGHVAIYSEPGEGTSVKLYLPRATSTGAHVTAPPQEKAMPAGSETILVVEDDPDVRAYVASALGVLGYTILKAEDGPSALALMKENPDVDLLFTDVVLPGGMNGRELADEIEKLNSDIKVLFTSGYTSGENF